MLNQPLASIK